MSGMIQDLRSGVRLLSAQMRFTVVAVVCLALGIATSTVVFGATYSIVLRQLPYPNAATLVEVRTGRVPRTASDSRFISVPATDDLIAQSQSFTSFGRYMPVTATLTGGVEPEQIEGLLVTPEWFSGLGVQPVVGRTIQAQDLAEGRERIAVISYSLWHSSFGGSPNAVGSEILLAAQPTNVLVPFAPPGKPYTIVGVMPERSRFPVDGEIWLPLEPARQAPTMGRNPRAARTIGMLARLRSGVSVSQANRELHLIAGRLAKEHPDTDRDWEFRCLPLRDAIVGSYSTILTLMLVAVNLVLLLTFISIGGLIIARSRARQKEVAVRQILGATRSRLIRLFVCEGALLATMGSAVGLVLSIWITLLVRRFAPASVPRLDALQFDPLVLVYVSVVGILAGVLIGVAPAIQLTTPRISTAVANYSSRHRGVAVYGFRLRGLLIGFEIALLVPVAIGAVLMLRSVGNLMAVDLGYRTDRILVVSLRLSSATCAKFALCTAALEDLLQRITAFPEVQAAAVSGTRPFGNPLTLRVGAGDTADERSGQTILAHFQMITPDYFRVLGVPVVRGRTFTTSDPPTQRVAVVNTAFGKQLFGDASPIGKRLTLAPAGRPESFEIIGQVGDMRDVALTRDARPTYYLSLAQAKLVPRTVLLIRTNGDALSVAQRVRATVQAVDRNAPVFAIDTLETLWTQQIAEQRFQALSLTVFAALGVVLAVIGIYGLISYATSDRFREFGIRLAIGATRGDIFRIVISEGVSTLGWGLTFGIAAGVGISRLLRGQLYEVSANDPATYLLVAAGVVAASVFAYALPARRATKVDPLVILRYE